MTSFAPVKSRAFLSVQGGHKVWRVFVALVEPLRGHVRVASLAGFRADIEGGIARRRIILLIGFVSGAMALRLSPKGSNGSREKEQETDEQNDSRLLPRNSHHHPPLPRAKTRLRSFAKL